MDNLNKFISATDIDLIAGYSNKPLALLQLNARSIQH